jgi:(S)-2-hydroxyglutarate dehydrogenase
MKYDVTIIGAGIAGLATAYRLLQKRPGLKVAVLEKEDTIAAHQTGHNSGVIHSGIYYKPGSLKALNCQQGYRELLEFCREYEVPHEVCGKVIVATKNEEMPLLENILERGRANGMKGLEKLGPEALKEIEPHTAGIAAVWVPQAGIVNYSRVAAGYARQSKELGAALFTGEKVEQITTSADKSVSIETKRHEYTTGLAVNCAGLYADKVAEMAGQKLDVQVVPFRGEYYVLRPETEYLVNNLIYPVPNPAFPFLGVHFTRMMEGGIEAGPNAVLAFRREGYTRWDFHLGEFAEILSFRGFQKLAAKYWQIEIGELHRSFSKRAFVSALRHLVPDIGMNDLTRGGAGVRAMAVGSDGNIADDFLIMEGKSMVHVINAPSPAATASLAIGNTIAETALKKLP